jgi:hypothetical protein
MLTDIRGKVLKNIMGHKNLNLDRTSLNLDMPVSSTDEFLGKAWTSQNVNADKVNAVRRELVNQGITEEDADKIVTTELRKKYGKQLYNYVNK